MCWDWRRGSTGCPSQPSVVRHRYVALRHAKEIDERLWVIANARIDGKRHNHPTYNVQRARSADSSVGARCNIHRNIGEKRTADGQRTLCTIQTRYPTRSFRLTTFLVFLSVALGDPGVRYRPPNLADILHSSQSLYLLLKYIISNFSNKIAIADWLPIDFKLVDERTICYDLN